MDCVFCREDGGDVLWQDDTMRVVLADEHDYPGFCRVIWNRHVAEFSDLAEADRGLAGRAGLERLLRGLEAGGEVDRRLGGPALPRRRGPVR